MQRVLSYLGVGLIGAAAIFFSLPSVVSWEQPAPPALTTIQPFPVTVHPKDKTITESSVVNEQLTSAKPFLMAAVGGAGDLFASIAAALMETPWYESLAAAIPIGSSRVVVIDPGYRREQAAAAFGTTLGWSKEDQQTFLASTESTTLAEGEFLPGAYVVAPRTTPAQVRILLRQRFDDDIIAHYPASVAAVVPLDDALTIASMIERETSDKNDMRIVSGIIWNRLFTNMRLQLDATVQYAKADAREGKTGWWPSVRPRDLSLKSPYNTYVNEGLPPGPIASPSIAAVLAALNPKQTTCLFYFHDNAKTLHCSDTYGQHVALLKKYFGRGK